MLAATAIGSVSELNELLSLTPTPNEDFRRTVTELVVADNVVSFSLSKDISLIAVRLRGEAAETVAPKIR